MPEYFMIDERPFTKEDFIRFLAEIEVESTNVSAILDGNKLGHINLCKTALDKIKKREVMTLEVSHKSSYTGCQTPHVFEYIPDINGSSTDSSTKGKVKAILSRIFN
ncbi:hypothetical protein H4219_003634 [Mycoemilia scoparia]|uniref:Uncharacterized protein n=1 Tax=Mycoemilia scoparia TaxID=417184 RepID=A0A9W8DSM5_9FUNG|nr:hypothetical protein H4219_003634 [Mycoemilia scoparia]